MIKPQSGTPRAKCTFSMALVMSVKKNKDNSMTGREMKMYRFITSVISSKIIQDEWGGRKERLTHKQDFD